MGNTTSPTASLTSSLQKAIGVGSSNSNSNSSIDKLILGNISNSESTEKFYGLENFGNTCYANSVVQSLYFCKPFRKAILHYYNNYITKQSQSTNNNNVKNTTTLQNNTNQNTNLLITLCELFAQLNNQKKKTGSSIGPKAFIQKLRLENELFKSFMQQDAQEFLNFILNHFVEILQKENLNLDLPNTNTNLNLQNNSLNPNQEINSSNDTNESLQINPNDQNQTQMNNQKSVKTFVHDIFEGTLRNETRCILCENVTMREESFLDISLDIEQFTSLTQCLKNFSKMQILKSNNKFYCDFCNCYQEAQLSMKIKKQPRVLALQLKRFKYCNNSGNFKKLSYRVTFPFELRLMDDCCCKDYNDYKNCKDYKKNDCDSDCDNTCDNNSCDNNEEEENEDKKKKRKYKLFAVVVHIGSGPNCGHYKCIIRNTIYINNNTLNHTFNKENININNINNKENIINKENKESINGSVNNDGNDGNGIEIDQWILFDDEKVMVVDEDYVRSTFGFPHDESSSFTTISETSYILFYSS